MVYHYSMRELILEEEVRNSIKIVYDHLQKLDIEYALASAGHNVLYTRIQAALKSRPTNAYQRTLYDVIITHAIEAEKLGPGGFKRCLEILLGDHSDKQHALYAKVPSENDIEKLIRSYCKTTISTNLVKDAINLAGFAGRIVIEKTTSSVTSVELVRGYTFHLQPLITANANLLNPRIICIDGYIENVSEIHHLLEALASAKEPCGLFVRGMSDDVKHTLKVNFDRGSLKLLPFAARFDLEGMNTLVDIATTSCGDVISSLKGDLISSIELHNMPVVEQLISHNGKVVITNSKSKHTVAIHVQNLREKRKNEQIDDIGNLLDARIKSLSPNHVVIRLPDDKNFILHSQSIDYALRAVRSAIEHGLLNGVPVATEAASSHLAAHCKNQLNSFGSLVLSR